MKVKKLGKVFFLASMLALASQAALAAPCTPQQLKDGLVDEGGMCVSTISTPKDLNSPAADSVKLGQTNPTCTACANKQKAAAGVDVSGDGSQSTSGGQSTEAVGAGTAPAKKR